MMADNATMSREEYPELSSENLSKLNDGLFGSGTRPLDILVLADTSVRFINTIDDHLNGLCDFSRNRAVVFDFRSFNRSDRWLPFPFERFDVIVVHYSVIVADKGWLSKAFRERLKAYRGLKVIFIQDEYRWVDMTAKAMEDIGFDVLFSVVNEEVVDKVYHHEGLKKVRKEVTLTGFVPTQLLSVETPAYQDRTIDVGYRARRVPTWLGAFAHEKWLIGQRFLSAVKDTGLSCDIESDEQKRLYGDAWIAFMSNCKAVLGTESGASVCDFDGSIQRGVEAYEAQHPDASFDEVRETVFPEADGALTISVISPRCFEAAALRTLMILYPGTYSGRLTPWQHYVPLERDFSNLDEVIAVIRDPARATAITERAYREVACNPRNTFQSMVADFDAVIADELPEPKFVRTLQTPSVEFMRRQGKRVQIYRRVRSVVVLTTLRFVIFVVKTLIPKSLQPAVLRTARSVWRWLIRAS